MPDHIEAITGALIGERSSDPSDVLGAAGAIAGVSGILQRLLESYAGEPVGNPQQLAVGAAAAGLVVPDGALSCSISVEVQPVRVTFAAGDPTAAVGFVLPAGTIAKITGRASMQSARFLGTVAGAIVNVVYWS